MILTVCLEANLLSVCQAQTKDLAAYARDYRIELAEKIMPYWYDHALDTNYGGYLLSDDANGHAPPAREKQIVTQSRMIWGFSRAHRNGLSDAKRNYLLAAQIGYRFLLDHFLDQEHGGYFWATDLSGQPINERKIVYGESFVIYALVEFYRASGNREALRQAIELYELLQDRSHDKTNGGWIEHFERDWKPILVQDERAIVEVGGYKSANTHLHLMEALTELYDASRDPEVKKSLVEAVRLNQTFFYPLDAGKSCFHRQLDWKPVKDPKSAGVSYGHNVEFAWLMVHAESVLGRKPSWVHFYHHLDHALKYGYDHDRGGLYNRGQDNQPATDTDKVWWVQAEMMAALTEALLHLKNASYSEALEKQIQFIQQYQTDRRDGIWLDHVSAEGKPTGTGKAHNWKANYHDVRALLMFVDAFAPKPKPL